MPQINTDFSKGEATFRSHDAGTPGLAGNFCTSRGEDADVFPPIEKEK